MDLPHNTMWDKHTGSGYCTISEISVQILCIWRLSSGGSRGEHRGPVPPPPSPMSLSSSRTDLLVLLNFNILLCFQPIFIRKHTKFTSKLQHFIEIEHFAVRKQQKTKRPRQLGGVVGRLWEAWPKFCARTCI